MAIWKQFSVKEMVSKIDEDYFVLPVIQREFVWGTDKIELLFDSLFKGNCFGAIMTIHEEKGDMPLFAFRKFSVDGGIIESEHVDRLDHEHYFVIDGQQRLQAFYIGSKGTYQGQILYFNLLGDLKSDSNFRFAKSCNDLPESEPDDEGNKIDCVWYRVPNLLKIAHDCGLNQRSIIRKIKLNRTIESEAQKERLEDNLKTFILKIVEESIGVSYLELDRIADEPYQQPEADLNNRLRIVELFRRLNDGGTRLSTSDLIISTLKGFDYRMESMVRGFESNKSFSELSLQATDLIQFIFMLRDKPQINLKNLDSDYTDFALNNKERIISSIKSAITFLKTLGLYDFYRTGISSVKPILYIAYFLFHKSSLNDEKIENYWNNYDLGNQDTQPLKEWIIKSLLNSVFSRGVGWHADTTGVKKIIGVLKKHKNEVFPRDELFKLYDDHPLHWHRDIRLEYIDNLNRAFVFFLMYGPAKNNHEFNLNDIDHIMPKSILEHKGYPAEQINSIKNFQLIDYSSNRGDKKGKPFREWISDPECIADKNSYLELHLIPKDESLWDEDKFLEFSEARGNLIIDHIKSCLDTLKH